MPGFSIRSPRRGFTLLELILALGLTAIVLLIVSSGIEVQLRAFDRSRARVERAQLARVLLHRIADDLGDFLEPVADSTGGPAMAASSNTTAGAGQNMGATDTAGTTGATDTSGAAAPTADSTGAATGGADATTAVAAAPPGVYGELDWLRIDVVRPPRRDVSSSGASSVGASSSSPEIHTVVYYALSPDEAAAQDRGDDSSKTAGGLVRRELSRPVAAWAAALGSFEYCDPAAKPLASDVTAVEFRYHDGLEWLESWDTAQKGSPPAAIEIRLFLSPVTAGQGRAAAAAASSTDAQPDAQYRLVVAIPLQESRASSAAGESESSEESGSTTSGSSESSGGGAGGNENTNPTGGAS